MRAALALSLLAAALLSGCAGEETPGLLPGGTSDTVTVYVFPGADRGHQATPLLYPEQVKVHAAPNAKTAVEALTAYHPGKPFENLWNGPCAWGKDLDTVTVTDDLITVHFNQHSGALCDLTQDGVDMMAQQLAWTVRTAASGAPVTVTVGDHDVVVMKPTRARDEFLAPTQ